MCIVGLLMIAQAWKLLWCSPVDEQETNLFLFILEYNLTMEELFVIET